MIPDPLTGIAFRLGTTAVFNKLRELLPRGNDEQLRLDYQEIVNEVALEMDAELKRFIARQQALNTRFMETLEQKLDKRAITVLYLQLHSEAVKSASKNRMRMMCAAAVGILDPDVHVETKSRVVRTISQLEPSDVLLLREKLEELRPIENHLIDWQGEGDLPSYHISTEALLSTGCARQVPSTATRTGGLGYEGGNHVDVSLRHEITDLGRAVLRFLEVWTPEEELQCPTP